ncbi:MAG: septum formation protein Maf [Rubrobacter sp.]|jgi:septum formation protein|nr:septum formation protein Maf [Rubrobacter sp.]
MRFTLASESPRRVSLLRGVGYDFDTRTSGFPEVSLETPRATVEANARGKALTVSKEVDGVVLGADTVVFSPDGEILGQAKNEDDARRMLSALHGRAHEVHSGVAVARGEEVVVRHSVTRVRMRSLSEEEISAYVLLGEWIGKAGGYAIQGKAALFVEWIGGDYTNVVGLPLALTCRMLEEFGVRWADS